MINLIIRLFLLLLLMLNGCGTTGKGLLYREPSIQWQNVSIQRVAIVPNRLPLNLHDPEKWRKTNWEIIKNEFELYGFDVIDYSTSVEAFERSGLPVEDTKSSRDKYAELASQLGVDAIIVPYYGTFGSGWGVLLINNISYTSVATLQIYLTKENDFVARIDANGINQYTTNIGPFAASGAAYLEPAFGVAVLSCWTIWDIIQSLRSPDARWESAFEAGLKEGLKPFFAIVQSTAFKTKGKEIPEKELSRGFSAIGVKAGLNVSNFTGEDLPEGDSKRRFGISSGLFIKYTINENFSIQPEALFTMKGEKLKQSDDASGTPFESNELNINLSYLDIIILTKLNLSDQGNIRSNIFLGPIIGFKLSSKISTEDENITGVNIANDIDIIGKFKDTDFGIVVGGGFEFPLNPGEIQVDARYNIGLNSVSKPLDLKNRTVSLMVGYSF